MTDPIGSLLLEAARQGPVTEIRGAAKSIIMGGPEVVQLNIIMHCLLINSNQSLSLFLSLTLSLVLSILSVWKRL